MPRKKTSRARPVLDRVYWILENYLTSIESSLQEQSPSAQDRERDARMINALARTLEKLATLEQLLAGEENRDVSPNGEDALRARLERRIAQLAAPEK